MYVTYDIKKELSRFPSGELSATTIQHLEEAARTCRIWSLVMTSAAGSGHPGGSLSSTELCLLVYGIANVNPENARFTERDRIVISHGHISPCVYSTLAYYGFIDPKEVLSHFRQAGSPFSGHVERKIPGIDWSTGNLGQGLAAGVGLALAQKARNLDHRVFVLLGDGEQVKGQLAEARRIAYKEKLSNLIAMVDYNHIQISGKIEEIMPAKLKELWEADGWQTLFCDGHDFSSLYSALKTATSNALPTVIFCHTIMGRGVSFMEGAPQYHGKPLSPEQLISALHELGAGREIWDQALSKRKEPFPEFLGPKIDLPPIDIDLGEPITYEAGQKLDNRSAFGRALDEVGKTNYLKPSKTPILVFDCDLAESVKVHAFARSCPLWFHEMGIQEHATATVSGAASTGGVISVWADFGVFGLDEVYNQQRLNDINEAPLKLVLTHVGLDVGEDGMTHQCIDYVGLLRNTFGWKLVVPADANQTDRVTRWALSEPSNICLAMGRSSLPVILKEDGTPFYDTNYKFEYGRMDLLRDGEDATIFCMGTTANLAISSAEKLKEKGLFVRVIHVPCPLAMSPEEFNSLVRGRAILTCEDHHVKSGLGSAIAPLLLKTRPTLPFEMLGVSRYGDSGASDDVFKRMGLDVSHIAECLETLLVGKEG